MAKKTAKKTAKKAAKKTAKRASVASKKFSFIDDLHARVLEAADTARDGSVRLKRIDFKNALEASLEQAAIVAAGGERVRFPVIGTLGRKEVKARKAGKGKNPFTGEEIMVKARAASKKPGWSFPKAAKEIFSTKKFW